jgi:hypothetical protein
VKNKYKLFGALCVSLATLIVVVYYRKPSDGMSHSELTRLRERARSEPVKPHSEQINSKRSAVANGQTLPSNKQYDPWHNVSVLLIGKNIHLTDAETAKLQIAYAELVKDRETLELSIVRRQQIDDTKILLTIPPYADAGAELYANFIRDVTSDFGVSRADEILNALDYSIIACNYGLGQQPQAILAEDQQRLLKISRGRAGVSTVVDGKKVFLPEVNATGLYEKDQLNAFAYLKPLLVPAN